MAVEHGAHIGLEQGEHGAANIALKPIGVHAEGWHDHHARRRNGAHHVFKGNLCATIGQLQNLKQLLVPVGANAKIVQARTGSKRFPMQTIGEWKRRSFAVQGINGDR